MMLYCTPKPSVSQHPITSMCRTLLPPNIVFAINHPKYPNFGASLVKKVSPCIIGIGSFSSCMGPYSIRVMHNTGETPHAVKSCKEQVKSNILEKQNLAEKMQVANPSFEFKDDMEIQKRRKNIRHATKGKVPWNKGRKHSEETRERIRQRTKEAMKDPKVRKKMSECPRVMSNQTKSRIRASLTKLWGKRLHWKRSREKFLQSWAESIANAAKLGSNDQSELDWDSYDKIKREITHLQQHEEAEKVKAKERARNRAERAAQVKAEKMAELAQKRKKREMNVKVGGESSTTWKRKSKEEIEKLAEFQEVKLKERLLKIHRRKSAINQLSNQHKRSWEIIDVDFMKGEQTQKDISLADQIRSAKNRRTAEQLLDDKL